MVGRRRTALGGATTRPARNSAENCERANISKTLTTTLTTSSETSTTSAELGTRQKMLPERRKRNPPPQVATTLRALEHHLVLLRRRNQVQPKIVLLLTSIMVKLIQHTKCWSATDNIFKEGVLESAMIYGQSFASKDSNILSVLEKFKQALVSVHHK